MNSLQTPSMNAKKKELVVLLRQNARVKLTTLAIQTGLAVSTLFERIHNLKELGITRLTALLDFAAIGYTTNVVILLKATKGSRERVKEFLLESANVNSAMRINNGYDFLIEGVFKDMADLEVFFEDLELKHGVKEKEVHFIIEELAREAFLTDPKRVQLN